MERTETSAIIYSDLNRDPAKAGTGLAYNLESLKQSLDNLFNTPYGTRSFQPTYGNTFHYILGELMTDTTTQVFYDKVVESVELNEPRVQLDRYSSSVTPIYEKNTYHVSLVFTVAGLSINDKFVYEIDILNTRENDK